MRAKFKKKILKKAKIGTHQRKVRADGRRGRDGSSDRRRQQRRQTYRVCRLCEFER